MNLDFDLNGHLRMRLASKREELKQLVLNLNLCKATVGETKTKTTDVPDTLQCTILTSPWHFHLVQVCL